MSGGGGAGGDTTSSMRGGGGGGPAGGWKEKQVTDWTQLNIGKNVTQIWQIFKER